MSTRVYVPSDSTARSLGADAIAVSNAAMIEIWQLTKIDTPIVINP